MNEIIRIGVDTSKSVFQLHGVDDGEQPALKRKLRRQDLNKFFGSLPRLRIGMEACGASHHWARELQALGHEVVLIPPQYTKPYVDRGKNDVADAEAIYSYEGTREMNTLIVGKSITGLSAFV